MSELVHHIA